MSEEMLRHTQGLRGGARTSRSAHMTDAWDVVETGNEEGEGDAQTFDTGGRVDHRSDTITWCKETQWA